MEVSCESDHFLSITQAALYHSFRFIQKQFMEQNQVIDSLLREQVKKQVFKFLEQEMGLKKETSDGADPTQSIYLN